jgi:hypothetical protein
VKPRVITGRTIALRLHVATVKWTIPLPDTGGSDRSTMKALTSKSYVLGLVLLALFAIPSSARADTYTLNGASIEGFWLDSGKSFVVDMPLGESWGWLMDEWGGKDIPSLTIDDYKTIGGVETPVGSYNFTGDHVGFWFFDWGWDGPRVNVGFDYTGNGYATVPEPSGLALLATGLLTLVGITRRKLFN